MLGMTIAEKLYSLEVDGMTPPTVEDLISILKVYSAFDKLIALSTEISHLFDVVNVIMFH
jgi:hypothetical protein